MNIMLINKQELHNIIIDECNYLEKTLDVLYNYDDDDNDSNINEIHIQMRDMFIYNFNNIATEYNSAFKNLIINDNVKLEIIKEYEDIYGEYPHNYQYDNGKTLILQYIAMIANDYVTQSYFCEK
jgi:hypothetical protein